MRVLVADKFEQSGLDGLTGLGCEVSCEPGLKDQALAERVAEFQPDVLIVRSTKVGEPVLAAGPLKLVVRAGAGYNTIDLASSSRRGIYVSNCPGKNSIAVAELAFGLILALDRRIADNVISLRAGKWNKAEFSKARGLFGRTLGLLGVGSIGSQMIPRRAGIKFQPRPVDDPNRRCPDISKARRLLDWEPKVSLDEGLAKTIAYFTEKMKRA